MGFWDARDDEGHYCGQVVATGEPAPIPPGSEGYCGPDCGHCAGARYKLYVEQDGVYVCAADYDYDREPAVAGAGQ